MLRISAERSNALRCAGGVWEVVGISAERSNEHEVCGRWA